MANSNGWGDGAANNSIGWGQGANNNIGWGDSHAKSWAGATDIVGLTTDADAQAFITAAAITDATQQTAINNLVVGMKADGIWTKMKAVYPFVGGTATTHKYNLKDPRDLDAAFRLVFNGGWTHSSNGATPNGVNSYADSKLQPSSVLTQNSTHLGYYTNQNVKVGAFQIGAFQSHHTMIGARFNSTTNYIGVNTSVDVINAETNNVNSFLCMSRISASEFKYYKTNTTFQTVTNNSSGLSPINIWLGALNLDNTTGFLPDTARCAFASIGNGLTDTEAANLYTRVQAFQTSLSRQV